MIEAAPRQFSDASMYLKNILQGNSIDALTWSIGYWHAGSMLLHEKKNPRRSELNIELLHRMQWNKSEAKNIIVPWASVSREYATKIWIYDEIHSPVNT